MSVKKNILKLSKANMDIIGIDDLEVQCFVGCTPEEQSQSQALLVSIVIEFPLQKSGRSDKLKDTLNYAAVINLVLSTIAGQTFVLIEAVAEKIAQVILAKFPLTHVKVRVAKKSLPDVKCAYVEIHR